MARDKSDRINFTYSKKNKDVKEIINTKKELDKNFVITDYICNCVRFYEKYNDKVSLLDNEMLKSLMREVLNEYDFSAKPNRSKECNTIDTTLALYKDDIDSSFLEED